MPAPATRARTREQELRAAAKRANLPGAAFRLYVELLDRADFGTAETPDKFQPRGLAELAKWCEMSKATAARALNLLEAHGWVQRNRATTLGRGHRTAYRLACGRPVDRPAPPEPLSDAERARRYRARKMSQRSVTKVSQHGVTDTEESVSTRDTSDPGKCLKMRQQSVSANVTAPQVNAGFVLGGTEGEGEEGARICAACRTQLDPLLAENGYRTHPLCEPYHGPAGDNVERDCAHAILDTLFRRQTPPQDGPALPVACSRAHRAKWTP